MQPTFLVLGILGLGLVAGCGARSQPIEGDEGHAGGAGPGATVGSNATSSTDAASTTSAASTSASGTGGAGGAGVCTPGMDETCNYYYPEMTSVVGVCNPDGTCTCNPGVGIVSGSGLCLDISQCTPPSVNVDSCHGNDTATGILGECQPDGTCICNPGYVLDDTGLCVSAVCHGGCSMLNDTRCAGLYLQVCTGPGNGCDHHWFTTDHCGGGQVCNSDGTHCVSPTGACGVDADCACGCACQSGSCVCGGPFPTDCMVDADCGPPCAGRTCLEGVCQVASSHP